MITFHAHPENPVAPPRPTPIRRWLARFFSASLSALAMTCAASAQDEKPYPPTPASQQAPTAAEESALRQHLALEETDELVRAGLSSAERESRDMSALGLNPDDPVALNAWRAEVDSNPNAIAASDDFALNTAWGTGGLNPERYAGSNDGIYRGLKAATLSTGEVVVIGTVKFNDASPLQLGITKRKANGSRATWTGVASQYSHYSGQYILYPNTNTSVPSVYSVHDVKVRGDKIYVLVTGKLMSPNTYAPNVLCFDAGGSSCGWWFAYSNGNSSVNDAVAMDIHQDHLVVLGRRSFAETGGFWTAKWRLGATGGLEDPAITDFPAPGGIDRSEPADIAFRRIGSLVLPGGNPGYYVLFTKKVFADAASTDYDPCLLAVKSDNTPDTSFDNAGVRCAVFDDAESSRKDKAIALVTNGWSSFSGSSLVNHEGVQSLVSVARKTDDGIGVWELLDRASHPRFGATGGAAGAHARGGGKVVVGGCGASGGEGCFSAIAGSALHAPMDLANVGADMFVVGYRYGSGFAGGGTRRESALIARLHGDSGELRQLTTFASGFGEGRFNSLVERNDHDVIGIGQAIDNSIATGAARTQIMTGLSNDASIFKDGFD